MADYLKQQIQERRLKRTEVIKGMQNWAKKMVNPLLNGRLGGVDLESPSRTSKGDINHK